VVKDGRIIRNYTYDSFGNRTEMADYDKSRIYAYVYDALNQMTEEEVWEEEAGFRRKINTKRTYAYDLRGNLISEYCGGIQSRGYEYNAMNRLSKSWNSDGRETFYRYNGLEQRIGKVSGDVDEIYLWDLTKTYRNLLEYQRGDDSQSIYWDMFPAVVERGMGRSQSYYMNDDLGSPLRVVYTTGRGNVYGYDEFGNDLYNLYDESVQTAYTRQGEGQPLGYTGYCYDDVSGTYFAQAREYDTGKGRFMARDIHWNGENSIYGDELTGRFMPNMGAVRQSANVYAYCMNNPVRYVDLLGDEAGDVFESMDDAAEDFAETTNAKSIENDWEYGAYIYAWEEKKEKKFLFLSLGTEIKRYYSYTEPHINKLPANVSFYPNRVELPKKDNTWNGKVWVIALAHTHGAYKPDANSEEYNAEDTDRISSQDEDAAESVKMPIYTVTPMGELRVYAPNEKSILDQHRTIVHQWKLPHDKNHPLRKKNHKKACKNCISEVFKTTGESCISDK
jgi:RHS repeat-associated core domain